MQDELLDLDDLLVGDGDFELSDVAPALAKGLLELGENARQQELRAGDRVVLAVAQRAVLLLLRCGRSGRKQLLKVCFLKGWSSPQRSKVQSVHYLGNTIAVLLTWGSNRPSPL